MDSCTILLPPKSVQVATIPAAKLRHHMILKEAVITGSIQRPISEDSQTKCPISVHAAEDHNLGVKSWCFHSKMAWTPSLCRIGWFQWCISADVLWIHQAIQLKIGLVTDQHFHHLRISSGNEPLAKHKAAWQVSWLQLVAANGAIGVIFEIALESPPSGLVQVDCIEAARAHWRDIGVANVFLRISIHHLLHCNPVLNSPGCPSPSWVGETRTGCRVAIENGSLLQLLGKNPADCGCCRQSNSRKFDSEAMEEVRQEIPPPPSSYDIPS